MTSLADAVYQVKYNPFKYGEFLASFYSELTNVEQNLLLAHLVVPLCSHHLFQDKLSSARFGTKNKSSIWTIFSDRTQLYDLQERLDDFRELTDQSLHYCLVNDWLEVDTSSLTLLPGQSTEVSFIKQKSAANLGKLLSNFSVGEIYAFLGVRPR